MTQTDSYRTNTTQPPVNRMEFCSVAIAPVFAHLSIPILESKWFGCLWYQHRMRDTKIDFRSFTQTKLNRTSFDGTRSRRIHFNTIELSNNQCRLLQKQRQLEWDIFKRENNNREIVALHRLKWKVPMNGFCYWLDNYLFCLELGKVDIFSQRNQRIWKIGRCEENISQTIRRIC